MNNIEEIIQAIFEENVIKIIMSGMRSSANKYKKIIIVKKKIKDNDMYQLAKYTESQAFHENLPAAELKDRVIELFRNEFRYSVIWTDKYEHNIRTSKKLEVSHSKKPIDGAEIQLEGAGEANNRQKNYILKEGTVIPPLIKLGVFTKEGKIVNSMYNKYKQINRIIEIVDDVIKEKEYKSMNIVDFGCGKSYLTFILYYYLKEIKNIDVSITGLDLKQDVVNNCNEAAREFGYEKVKFKQGDISRYEHNSRVDMVITLHACDTATDHAIYNAVKWGAEIIMSVPCCQHEINAQIESEKYSILAKYGILKERFSAIVTDAVRGNMLEIAGYQTQIMEFVDFSHSPKNILIRAVKGHVPQSKKEKALGEIKSIVSEFGLKPKLYELLKDDLQLGS